MASARLPFRKAPRVKGLDLPGPRFTVWAWLYFALYVAVPILALGLLLDIAFYVIAERWFGTCYAILCLFE